MYVCMCVCVYVCMCVCINDAMQCNPTVWHGMALHGILCHDMSCYVILCYVMYAGMCYKPARCFVRDFSKQHTELHRNEIQH